MRKGEDFSKGGGEKTKYIYIYKDFIMNNNKQKNWMAMRSDLSDVRKYSNEKR